MATFAGLERIENPTADLLKTTLREYAEGGLAISARVVIGIISRTPLDAVEKAELHQLARKGEVMQKRVCHKQDTKDKESGEYNQVLWHLCPEN